MALEALRQQIYRRLDEIITECLHDSGPTSFLDFVIGDNYTSP